MNELGIQKFEKLDTQIAELYKEISILSKKSPDSPINKFKLGFVNKLLSISNELLTKIHKPFDDFDLFDEDDLPTNSDIIMMLSQYIDSLASFKIENVKYASGIYFWIIDGKQSEIRTSNPSFRTRR
ncbi:hypothetical protein [Acetobacterium bakii]|uniref:Uncharacterized protein n=1 Tax=Acetobacterium bakii TaxID=52689 RepID=A0A0L6TWJ5_9FIRM|nr:hypothetical protein [Acetobacterium bakii]KNZ40646.1 hypothetical protein AKG39_16385 [Acetobacterium bakii]